MNGYPLVLLHDASIILEKWLDFVPAWPDHFRPHRTDSDPRLPRHYPRQCSATAWISTCVPASAFASVTSLSRICRDRVIDEAVTACTGRVAARLGCHTISVEQPLSPRSDAVSGCPTARLLRNWPRSTVSTRHH
jgi:hypothetical protein